MRRLFPRPASFPSPACGRERLSGRQSAKPGEGFWRRSTKNPLPPSLRSAPSPASGRGESGARGSRTLSSSLIAVFQIRDSRSRSRGACAPEAWDTSPHQREGVERREAHNSIRACEARRVPCERDARLAALHGGFVSVPGHAFATTVARHGQPAPGRGIVVSPGEAPGRPGARLRASRAGAAPCSARRTSPEDAPQRARRRQDKAGSARGGDYFCDHDSVNMVLDDSRSPHERSDMRGRHCGT